MPTGPRKPSCRACALTWRWKPWSSRTKESAGYYDYCARHEAEYTELDRSRRERRERELAEDEADLRAGVYDADLRELRGPPRDPGYVEAPEEPDTRTNPGSDEELRELERRARAGDENALLELDRRAEDALGHREKPSYKVVFVQMPDGLARLSVSRYANGYGVMVVSSDGTGRDVRWSIPGLGQKYVNVTYHVDNDGSVVLSDLSFYVRSQQYVDEPVGDGVVRWAEQRLTPAVRRWVGENGAAFAEATARLVNENVRTAAEKFTTASDNLRKAEAEYRRALAAEIAIGRSPLDAPRLPPKPPKRARRRS